MVCSPPTSPALQSAAVESLSRFDDPRVVDGFMRLWPILTPPARSRAISALLSRDAHVEKVLNAIQNRSILSSDLSSAQRNFLRTHSVPAVQSRALQLLGPVPVTRPEVITRYQPALTMRVLPIAAARFFDNAASNAILLPGRLSLQDWARVCCAPGCSARNSFWTASCSPI